MENVTLYKVISKDAQSKDGGSFDWTPYLPKGNRKGKWTPVRKVIACSSGWHVTRYWNMWYATDCRIFEVEVDGKYEETGTGVVLKQAFKRIRLIREVFFTFDEKNNTGDWNTGHRNTGDWNTGHRNTGDRNTGHHNTGDRNTGHHNTGDRNTGHHNTGNCNTGNWNTGHRNTGHRNTGDWNTGHRNTGDWNTGNWNTGHRNTGHRNTGNRNTGNWNTGNWNRVNYSTGFFNTIREETIQIFNKPCKRSDWEKAIKPTFLYFEIDSNLGYKKSFQKSFKAASKEDVELLKALPNFDAQVFYEISGITIK